MGEGGPYFEATCLCLSWYFTVWVFDMLVANAMTKKLDLFTVVLTTAIKNSIKFDNFILFVHYFEDELTEAIPESDDIAKKSFLY